MRIKRVVIENFRSIKKLEFYPAEICALVGENNAGKSNILAALNFLLGERWPSKQNVEVTDYYNQDTTTPIFIGVEFEENPAKIQCVWCRMPFDDKAETRFRYFEDKSDYYLSGEVRDQCALVYLDANRDLEYHLGHSRWTLFGRIIRQLDENFRGTVPTDQQEALVQSFDDALGYLKTELFNQFEGTFTEAFDDQIRRTSLSVGLEFRTFDPINYYRSIVPLLIEDNKSKNPSEAGQGMRNLILLALFRAYAKVFRGDAIIAIEEPEIYLHPHARRSLYSVFQELAQQGNQIFFSTHSGDFVHIERFDHICLVRKLPDDNGNLCTQVRQVSPSELLNRRNRLYPNVAMSEHALRERYHNICGIEHNEAFFARKILLVEGQSEEYTFPIFAQHLGFDFDANGISVVNAHSKNNLDQLYQLYDAFGIPIYLVFDNDRGKDKKDLEQNKILLEMLGEPQELEPEGRVEARFAILEGDFEREMEVCLEVVEAGKYSSLKQKAAQVLGTNAGKGIVARYIAQKLVNEDIVPTFIKKIVEAVRSLDEPLSVKNDQESDW